MSEQAERDTRRQRRNARRIAAERAAQQRRQRLMVGAAVLVALVAAIALIVLNRPAPVTIAGIIVADPPPEGIPTAGRTMGDPAAPVHLIEWGDYT